MKDWDMVASINRGIPTQTSKYIILSKGPHRGTPNLEEPPLYRLQEELLQESHRNSSLYPVLMTTGGAPLVFRV